MAINITSWILILSMTLSFGIILAAETGTLSSSTRENAYKIAERRDKRNGLLVTPAEYVSRLAKYIASLLHYDIGYYLFTPRNPVDGYNLKPTISSLKNSSFNSEWKTKLIIHGYSMNLTSKSVFYDIKDELLRAESYNVIVVDWTKYNKGSYEKAVVRGAVTGLDVANLIQFLMENAGIKAESVHIIGHSLGAQVAGFAGKTTPNLGRISGLDAAGPIFNTLPNALRLYHTDALFVDAMHTDGALNALEGYGTLLPYGDMDFFPNGGSTQPGCTSDDTFRYTNYEIAYANTKEKKISCNHNRAPFLFLVSIRQCNFLSVLCDGYDSLRKGECLLQGQCPSEGSVTANMGFHARPLPSLPPKSTFFLRTKKDPPFCIDCNKKK